MIRKRAIIRLLTALQLGALASLGANISVHGENRDHWAFQPLAAPTLPAADPLPILLLIHPTHPILRYVG